MSHLKAIYEIFDSLQSFYNDLYEYYIDSIIITKGNIVIDMDPYRIKIFKRTRNSGTSNVFTEEDVEHLHKLVKVLTSGVVRRVLQRTRTIKVILEYTGYDLESNTLWKKLESAHFSNEWYSASVCLQTREVTIDITAEKRVDGSYRKIELHYYLKPFHHELTLREYAKKERPHNRQNASSQGNRAGEYKQLLKFINAVPARLELFIPTGELAAEFERMLKLEEELMTKIANTIKDLETQGLYMRRASDLVTHLSDWSKLW